MVNDTLKLTDEKVLTYARENLKANLPLQAAGYDCTTDDLLQVLLGVAANHGTLESVCADLVGSPAAETIRTYFRDQLRVEDLPELEERLNAALASELPQRLWRQALEVAIDFHDRPYYGKMAQAEGLWVRGYAREGTTHFYRIATAYVMLNNLRVTLALHFVLPHETTVSIVANLQKRLKTLGIQIACLFLDKGFESVALMEDLTQQQQPAVIACAIRGKTGGTRALCRGNKSYRTTHTFRAADQTTFTAQVAVCRTFTTAKRTGRMNCRAVWLLFIIVGLTQLNALAATYGDSQNRQPPYIRMRYANCVTPILIGLDWSPRYTRQQYRRRFGIESSYRCAAQLRGWTTSPNPAYRFLLLALSFVLLNVWVYLRWLFTQVPRRGRRWLDTQLFPLSRVIKFIRRALERQYGYLHEFLAPAVPLL